MLHVHTYRIFVCDPELIFLFDLNMFFFRWKNESESDPELHFSSNRPRPITLFAKNPDFWVIN